VTVRSIAAALWLLSVAELCGALLLSTLKTIRPFRGPASHEWAAWAATLLLLPAAVLLLPPVLVLLQVGGWLHRRTPRHGGSGAVEPGRS